MKNDSEMRRIMEQLLSNILAPFGFETVKDDLFVPRHHQTEEFFQNITTVLSAKRVLIYKRWENFCSVSCFNALTTHEMYFRYVMFACDMEVRFCDNIFDKIISVFALVIHFNIETYINSNVNFCEFSVDMFMVFYDSTLKKSFYKKGGFKQFSEYLRGHEYLPLEYYMRNNLHVSDVIKGLILRKTFQDEFDKKTQSVPYHLNFITHYDVLQNSKSEFLAKEVLSTTKIKLPKLTNPADLRIRLKEAADKKAAMIAFFDGQRTGTVSVGQTMPNFLNFETPASLSTSETFATSLNLETTLTNQMMDDHLTSETTPKLETTSASSIQETLVEASKWEMADRVSIQKTSEATFKCKKNGHKVSDLHCRTRTEASSKRETTEQVLPSFENLECQINKAVKQKKHLDWCENIIQKVVKYNNSKSSHLVGANNEILKEADKLLKQLNDKIQSLINIL